MIFKTHVANDIKIAEVLSENILIQNKEDGLDLLGNLYFQGFDRIIIHEKNICPEFFDLKTGMAGEILQKFSNYRVRLVIIGNFGQFSSKSFRDFIYESNRGKQVNFLDNSASAIDLLSIY